MKDKSNKITQPMYDFQATEIYDIMIKYGVDKEKASFIILDYVDKNGLLEWNQGQTNKLVAKLFS